MGNDALSLEEYLSALRIGNSGLLRWTWQSLSREGSSCDGPEGGRPSKIERIWLIGLINR